MPRKRLGVGAVVQIALPSGEYAYGRILRDAAIAFYRTRSKGPGQPPIGSRDYEFVVAVYDDAVALWPAVGTDPSLDPNEDWPPPTSVTDPITQRLKYIYERGEMRPVEPGEDGVGLEPCEVWERREIVDRLMKQAKVN